MRKPHNIRNERSFNLDEREMTNPMIWYQPLKDLLLPIFPFRFEWLLKSSTRRKSKLIKWLQEFPQENQLISNGNRSSRLYILCAECSPYCMWNTKNKSKRGLPTATRRPAKTIWMSRTSVPWHGLGCGFRLWWRCMDLLCKNEMWANLKVAQCLGDAKGRCTYLSLIGQCNHPSSNRYSESQSSMLSCVMIRWFNITTWRYPGVLTRYPTRYVRSYSSYYSSIKKKNQRSRKLP